MSRQEDFGILAGEYVKVLQASCRALASVTKIGIEKLREQQVPDHSHDIRIVGVQNAVTRPLEPKMTLALFGCRTCPFVSSEEIQGSWTLDQIQDALDSKEENEADDAT